MKSNRGGARPGSGRKTKSEEQALIERLAPYDDLALQALIRRVQSDDIQAIKLFMEYRFGKPKQDIDLRANVHLADEPVIFE